MYFLSVFDTVGFVKTKNSVCWDENLTQLDDKFTQIHYMNNLINIFIDHMNNLINIFIDH